MTFKNWIVASTLNGLKVKDLQPPYKHWNSISGTLGILIFSIPMLLFFAWIAPFLDNISEPSTSEIIAIVILFFICIVFFSIILGLGAMFGYIILASILMALGKMSKTEAKELILLSKFPARWFDTTFD